MALQDIADLIFEPCVGNNRKQMICKKIIEEGRKGRVLVIDMRNHFEKEFDGAYGIVLYHKVVRRMKDLGILRVKVERDIETKKKHRIIELTPDAFEWFFKFKIIKVMKG
jgi:hypothetical protein